MTLQQLCDPSPMSRGATQDLASPCGTVRTATPQALLGKISQQAAARQAASTSLGIQISEQVVGE
jgi:hypothetical protein